MPSRRSPPVMGEVMFYAGVAGLFAYPLWHYRRRILERMNAAQILTVGAILVILGIGWQVYLSRKPISDAANSNPVVRLRQNAQIIHLEQAILVFPIDRFIPRDVQTIRLPDGDIINSYHLYIGVSTYGADLQNVQVEITRASGAGTIHKLLPPGETGGVHVTSRNIVYFSFISGWSHGKREYSNPAVTDVKDKQFADQYKAHLTKGMIL